MLNQMAGALLRNYANSRLARESSLDGLGLRFSGISVLNRILARTALFASTVE